MKTDPYGRKGRRDTYMADTTGWVLYPLVRCAMNVRISRVLDRRAREPVRVANYFRRLSHYRSLHP